MLIKENKLPFFVSVCSRQQKLTFYVSSVFSLQKVDMKIYMNMKIYMDMNKNEAIDMNMDMDKDMETWTRTWKHGLAQGNMLIVSLLTN